MAGRFTPAERGFMLTKDIERLHFRSKYYDEMPNKEDYLEFLENLGSEFGEILEQRDTAIERLEDLEEDLREARAKVKELAAQLAKSVPTSVLNVFHTQ